MHNRNKAGSVVDACNPQKVWVVVRYKAQNDMLSPVSLQKP